MSDSIHSAPEDLRTGEHWQYVTGIFDKKRENGGEVDEAQAAYADAMRLDAVDKQRERESRDKNKAENRKLFKWAVPIIIGFIITGGGVGTYKAVTAPEEVEPVDVQETVEAATTEANARDIEAAEARKQLGKQTWKNHTDIEDLKIRSVESTDYIIKTLRAMSPKAAIEEPDGIDAARTEAAKIKTDREKQTEEPDPFE